MGYNPSPSVVVKYASTLEEIKGAIDSGQELYYQPSKGQNLHSLSEQISNFLRSAKRFTGQLNGRYADLRERTTVSVDWDNMRVIVRPRGSYSPTAQPAGQIPDERITLMSLPSLSSPTQLHFKPSPTFDINLFDRQLRALGWELAVVEEDDPGDPFLGVPEQRAGDYRSVEAKADGWVGLIAKKKERTEERRPSILEQFGFSTPTPGPSDQ